MDISTVPLNALRHRINITQKLPRMEIEPNTEGKAIRPVKLWRISIKRYFERAPFNVFYVLISTHGSNNIKSYISVPFDNPLTNQ